MKIYLDVLMLTNAVIVLTFIRCICLLTREEVPVGREILGACIGGIGSLIAAVPASGFWASLAVTAGKGGLILIVVWAVFRPKSMAAEIRLGVLYLLCELLLGGCCYLLVSAAHRRVLFIKNYVIYFDITLPQLGICCAGVYAVMMLFEISKRRHTQSIKRYRVTFRQGSFSAELPAVADTGNKLCDSFTGAPVVIFRSDELYERYELDREERLGVYGFHPIPYRTINGEGLIYVTGRGEVTIKGGGMEKRVKCCAGMLPEESGAAYAIFNPEIL